MPQPSRATLFPYTTLFRSILEIKANPAETRHAAQQAVAGEQFIHPQHSLLEPHRVHVGGDERHIRANRADVGDVRSEEHTSELQSRRDLVCRLLPEKKKSG